MTTQPERQLGPDYSPRLEEARAELAQLENHRTALDFLLGNEENATFPDHEHIAALFYALNHVAKDIKTAVQWIERLDTTTATPSNPTNSEGETHTMSSFVVADATIDTIIGGLVGAFALDKAFPHAGLAGVDEVLADPNPLTTLGRALRAMNVEAVRTRYGDPFDMLPEEPYVFRLKGIPTVAAVAKALNCYLYQCSEGDIPSLPLFQFLDGFRTSFVPDMAAIRNSPEYDALPWG